MLLVAFLLGGALIAHQQGTSLWAAFTDSSPQQAAIPSETTTAAALTIPTEAVSIADMVEIASPAVVNIKSTVKVSSVYDNPFFSDPFFREFFGPQSFNTIPQYETGIGTGFLITADGYILTNQHVIEDATKVTVQLNGKSEEIPAQMISSDRELDLAVLKISGSNYPVLPLGNSDQMRVGEWVVAIGQPYGLDHTVTTGVISAKGRPISIEDRQYKNLIQTDAAINPGNSGGPLLNLKGEVIAINTAVNAQAQGIGFAIPINTVQEVLQDLISGNKIVRPYLGIRMADLNDQLRSELNVTSSIKGTVIVEVVSGSPAAAAGLSSKDIITSLNDTPVESASGLQDLIAAHKVGDKVSLNVIRSGRQMTLNATLQAKPNA
ncbi:MAG TPA: trypsin-like peptidase domain-containing protein [Syntrophomonas sp.]|nr:trypsin-like peptidase domain-containing protein [Syntrophomonas sp.]